MNERRKPRKGKAKGKTSASRRAAIYVRISSDKTGEGAGVARQEEDCRELAERLGWDVLAVFSDNDISAFSGKHRPGYEALLEAIRHNEVNAVLAWHPDRMHRRPAELEEFIDLVENAGVAIRTAQAGDLDLSTPSGRMIARQLGVYARFESEHKSVRIRRAKRQQAESGAWQGTRNPPFGYRQVADAKGKQTITPEPGDKALLHEAAERIMNGETLFGVCNDWNERGLTTSRGAHWRSKTLKFALLNPAVIGKRQTTDPDTDEQVLHDGQWEPIMDRVTWDRLQDILTDPRRTWEPLSGSYAARLALGGGLTVCDLCGKLLVSQRRQGRSRLICHKQATNGCGRLAIDYEQLEEFVLSLVWASLDTPEVAASRGRRVESAEDVEIRQEIRDIEALHDKNYDAWQDGLVDKDRYLRRKAELDHRLEAAEKRREDLMSGLMLDGVPTLEAARERWDRGDVPWRRAFISALVREIRVRPHPRHLATTLRRHTPEGETEEEFNERRYRRIHEIMRERLVIDWRA